MFDPRQLSLDHSLHVQLVGSVQAWSRSILIRLAALEHVKELLTEGNLYFLLRSLRTVVGASWNSLCSVHYILTDTSHLRAKRPLLTIRNTWAALCGELNLASVIISRTRPIFTSLVFELLANSVRSSLATIKDLFEVVILAR